MLRCFSDLHQSASIQILKLCFGEYPFLQARIEVSRVYKIDLASTIERRQLIFKFLHLNDAWAVRRIIFNEEVKVAFGSQLTSNRGTE